MSNPLANSDAGAPPEGNAPPKYTKFNDSVWELHKPSKRIPEVEIIFFHGLQPGHDYKNAFWKNWTARNNGDLVWPKVWLGEAFPQARILSISYESFAEANFDRLGEILIKDIINDAHNIGQFCPVILVGHGLGGIVIKQFVLSTCKETYRNNFRHFKVNRFRENFKGVLYYATPHGDAQLSNFERFMPEKNPYANFFGMLNKNMQNINEEFRAARGKFFNAVAWTVAEGLPTATKHGSTGEGQAPNAGQASTVVQEKSVRVVEEESAQRDTNVYLLVEDADHFGICKPENKDSIIVLQLKTLIDWSITRVLGTLQC